MNALTASVPNMSGEAVPGGSTLPDCPLTSKVGWIVLLLPPELHKEAQQPLQECSFSCRPLLVQDCPQLGVHRDCQGGLGSYSCSLGGPSCNLQQVEAM